MVTPHCSLFEAMLFPVAGGICLTENANVKIAFTYYFFYLRNFQSYPPSFSKGTMPVMMMIMMMTLLCQ
jgi:hypothetical protein